MPPDALDFSRRAQLTELMDEPCSREQLRACLRDLARVNRWLGAYRPTLAWLNSLALHGLTRPVRVLDVGCGYGDTLRCIEQWARRKRIDLELTGLDRSADAVAIASEASHAGSRIRWVHADVFAFEPTARPHLVVSGLFTHHLSDAQVVRFLHWMERHAELGWFINDLSRASPPYHAFRWFSKLMRLHPFVQHDGPVSIARAFVAAEWHALCSSAGLGDRQVSIRQHTPARLCVGRRKQR